MAGFGVPEDAAVARLLVEAGVRRLLARYADAVWRSDVDDFVDCFKPDAEWKIAGRHFRGPREIGEGVAQLIAGAARVRLIADMPSIALSGDGAIGRVPVTELVKLRDGSGALTLGVYHDHYVAHDDGWRFARRHFALHYRGPPDLSAPLSDSPDHGRFPAMPAHDAPTLSRQSG